MKTYTIILMIGAALLFDLAQAIVGWIPFVGNAAADIMSLFIFVTFFIWFGMNGISMITPKRLSALVGGGLVEMVPYLNILPAWTAVVIYLIGTTKIQEIADKNPALASLAMTAGGKIKSLNKDDRLPHVPLVDER